MGGRKERGERKFERVKQQGEGGKTKVGQGKGNGRETKGKFFLIKANTTRFYFLVFHSIQLLVCSASTRFLLSLKFSTNIPTQRSIHKPQNQRGDRGNERMIGNILSLFTSYVHYLQRNSFGRIGSWGCVNAATNEGTLYC